MNSRPEILVLDGLSAAQLLVERTKIVMGASFRQKTHETLLVRRFRHDGEIMAPDPAGGVLEVELSAGVILPDSTLVDAYVRARFENDQWTVTPSIEVFDTEARTVWQAPETRPSDPLQLASALEGAAQHLLEFVDSQGFGAAVAKLGRQLDGASNAYEVGQDDA